MNQKKKNCFIIVEVCLILIAVVTSSFSSIDSSIIWISDIIVLLFFIAYTLYLDRKIKNEKFSSTNDNAEKKEIARSIIKEKESYKGFEKGLKILENFIIIFAIIGFAIFVTLYFLS